MNSPGNEASTPTAQAIEIAIRLGLIFLILAWCLQILTPFVGLIAWGAIIAVAIYKPYLKLVAKMGGRKKLALTLIVVGTIAAILVPVISLSGSMIDSAKEMSEQFQAGRLHVPPPSESVREWPLVGEKVYKGWHQASVDLAATVEQYPDQLKTVSKKLLGAAKGVGAGIFQFIISMLIAAVFLASAESAGAAMHKIAKRLTGDSADSILNLSTATIRSVAVGVIGIAFIQALLGGLGMMFAGVPAAGLLAIVILVLAIAQLPPLVVLLPVMFYVFSAESTTVAVIFMVWSILVSMSDAVLKPIFLGRGVDVPMLVILLGAIGGMITSGIVGLFIGAIILALGYTLLQTWLDWGTPKADDSGAGANSVSQDV
jgi:predicted PurR-regulated permease PerM